MSEKAWNSLQWEPDFARPDKVLANLNAFTKVLINETSVLVIDDNAFNKLDHNYLYASEFKRMKTSEDNLISKHKTCDSTKLPKRFGAVRIQNKKNQNKKCGSLFNARSFRFAEHFKTESNGGKTNVKEAGLEDWQVSQPRNSETDMPNFVFYSKLKFVISEK